MFAIPAIGRWTLVLCLLLTLPRLARADDRSTAVTQAAWIVGWDNAGGLADLRRDGADFDEIVVFAEEFDAHGRLHPADESAELPALIRPLLKPNARLFISIVNDVEGKPGKQPGLVRDLLKNDRRLGQHIHELVSVAAPFDGLEIDYEALKKFPSDETLKNNFSRFIETLAQALHAHGKRLAIDVEPDPRNLDWHALGAAVDEFKIMAYYDHGWGTAPGPLITPATLERVLRYAQTQGVPAEKLVVALPTYGFDWTQTGSSWHAEQLEHEDPAALAARRQVDLSQVARDSDHHPHFTYEAGGEHHEVWYADTESLAADRAIVRQIAQRLGYPVLHWGFWRLGRGHIDYSRLSQE